MNTTNLMKQDWDERARKDAFHFIASWQRNWDPETFFQSGEEDYQRFVVPIFGRNYCESGGKIMLELGCGAGRMTRSFAQRFSHVIAFDISPEMLRRAQELLPQASNVDWSLGNGVDLSGVSNESVDFVFSYIVLQHMPTQEFAFRYIREMLRVLKPDGKFLFQFNSVPKVTMNWKGRLAWRIVDFPWTLGLRGLSRGTARLFGFSPEIAGKSWRGASLDVQSVRGVIIDCGGILDQVINPSTPMTWCCGSKSRAQFN